MIRMLVSKEDYEALTKAIDEGGDEPTEELKQAAERYKKRVISNCENFCCENEKPQKNE